MMLAEKLEDRQLLAANLAILPSGLSDYFDSIQHELNAEVFNAPIPVAGDQLAAVESAGQFANELRSIASSVNILATDSIAATKGKLATAFGGLLVNDGGQAIKVIGNESSDEVRFQFSLAGQKVDVVDLDLAMGSDAIVDIRLGGADTVDLTLDWRVDVNFTIRDEGNNSVFYANVSPLNEVTINVAADLNNGRFARGYGPLGVFVGELDDAGRETRFYGAYTIDINSDSGTSLVSESADLDVDGRLTGSGVANFATTGSFFSSSFGDSDFNLRVGTDLAISYAINNDSTEIFVVDPDTNETTMTRSLGSDPTIEYSNVGLDLGTFYDSFLGPVVGGVQEALLPYKPITDFLTAEIPVISDLYKLIEPESVTTPLTLARRLSFDDPAQQRAIDNSITVVTLINNILAFDLTPNQDSGQMLGLGGFEFSYNRSVIPPSDPGASATPTNLGGTSTITALDKVNDPTANLDNDSATKEWLAGVGANFDVPILSDPSLAFDLLLGKTDPQLFTAAIDLNFGFDFSKSFPIFAGLNANLGFNFAAIIDLDIGYDAYGAANFSRVLDYSNASTLAASATNAKFLLRDGFYFDDHFDENSNNVKDGASGDGAEGTLSITASAGASVGAELGVFSVTAGANINLTTALKFDFNDLPTPTSYDQNLQARYPSSTNNYEYDGRVRLSEFELAADAVNFGAINSSGELIAGLEAFLKLQLGFGPAKFTVADLRYTLFEAVIFSFDIYTPSDEFIINGGTVNPPLFGSLNNGNLDLFAGSSASSRQNTNRNRTAPDGSQQEEYYVRALTAPDAQGRQELSVTFRTIDLDGQQVTHRQTFEGVQSIRFDGGMGDDKIIVDSSVAVPVDLKGGSGNDVLLSNGTGVAIIDGGVGDDKIMGGTASDTLIGGPGNDELFGGDGADILYGGDDADILDGGAGNDQLYGEAGSDSYYWVAGEGNDTVTDLVGTDNSLVTLGSSQSAGLAFANTSLDDTFLVESDGGVANRYFVHANGSTISANHVSGLSISTLDGADRITVGDLAQSGIAKLDISVGDALDRSADTVFYAASGFDDVIVVSDVIDDSGAGETQQRVKLTDGAIEFTISGSQVGQDKLQINGLGGDDTIDVNSALIDLKVSAGGGNDTIRASYGNLEADGDDGFDVLELRDDGEVGGLELVTTTDSAVARRDGGDLQDTEFAGFERLDVQLGGASNTVSVRGTAVPTNIFGSASEDLVFLEQVDTAGPILVAGGAGNDDVTLGKNGSLRGIRGDVVIQGKEGIDRVIYDSSSEAGNLSPVINETLVSGLEIPGAVTFDATTEGVELRLGVGDDTVSIPSLLKRVVVRGGGGRDSATANSAAAPSPTTASLETSQTETVTFNHTSVSDTAWVIYENQLQSAGSFVIKTTDAELTTYNLGDGIDQVTIAGWFDHETRVNTGGGNDRIQVGDPASVRTGEVSRIGSIESPLVIDGGSGSDDVILNDTTNTSEQLQGVLDRDRVLGFGIDIAFDGVSPAGGRLAYTNVESVTFEAAPNSDYDIEVVDTTAATVLNLSSGDESVTVQDNSDPLTINFAEGDDTVYLQGAGAKLNLLGGPNSDTFSIDFSNLDQPVKGDLVDAPGGGLAITGFANLAGAAISIKEFEDVTVRLSQNSDELTVDFDNPDIQQVSIDAGPGDDLVTVKSVGSPTSISAGSGQDQVTVSLDGNPADSSELANRLSFDPGLESLTADNATHNGAVNWSTTQGVLSANGEAILNINNVGSTRIASGSGENNLTIDETADRVVEVSIDGQQINVTSGEQVLTHQDFAQDRFDIPLEGLTGVSDTASLGEFVYAVSPIENNLLIFRKVGSELRLVNRLINGVDVPGNVLAGPTVVSVVANNTLAVSSGNAVSLFSVDLQSGNLSFLNRYDSFASPVLEIFQVGAFTFTLHDTFIGRLNTDGIIIRAQVGGISGAKDIVVDAAAGRAYVLGDAVTAFTLSGNTWFGNGSLRTSDTFDFNNVVSIETNVARTHYYVLKSELSGGQWRTLLEVYLRDNAVSLGYPTQKIQTIDYGTRQISGSTPGQAYLHVSQNNKLFIADSNGDNIRIYGIAANGTVAPQQFYDRLPGNNQPAFRTLGPFVGFRSNGDNVYIRNQNGPPMRINIHTNEIVTQSQYIIPLVFGLRDAFGVQSGPFFALSGDINGNSVTFKASGDFAPPERLELNLNAGYPVKDVNVSLRSYTRD